MTYDLLDAWQRTPAGWERRGRPLRHVDDDPNFVLGMTKPTRSNTGLAARGVSEAQLSNYAGTFTNVSKGEKIDRLLITGSFRPNNTCTLSESKVVGPAVAPPLGETFNLVDTRSLAIDDPVRVEYCDLSPQTRTVDMYGVAYGQVEVYRSIIEGVVDGMSVHGAGTWPATIHRTVRLLGSLLTDSPWYADDPRQTDGSHNDFIQAHGSLQLLMIWGNTFGLDGEKADTSILIQQAHGLYDAVRIIENWFHGHPSRGAVFNMTETRGVGFTDLQFLRNRISSESNHSNPSPIVVKTLSRIPENFGWTGTVGSSPSTWVAGPDASYYMDGPNQGQPVRPKAG